MTQKEPGTNSYAMGKFRRIPLRPQERKTQGQQDSITHNTTQREQPES